MNRDQKLVGAAGNIDGIAKPHLVVLLRLDHGDVFLSDDWAFGKHVFLGVDVKLTRSIGLILEARYDWAEADVRGSFVGFDSIDLDGARILIGLDLKL